MDLRIFRGLVLGHGHDFGTWRLVFVDGFELLFEIGELCFELLGLAGFFGSDWRIGGFLGRKELHRIDGHVALGGGIGDENEALAIRLETEGAERGELQAFEIIRGELEGLQVLAVGM